MKIYNKYLICNYSYFFTNLQTGNHKMYNFISLFAFLLDDSGKFILIKYLNNSIYRYYKVTFLWIHSYYSPKLALFASGSYFA